ncbi:hypothetical protein ACFX14_012417 [Malus domestica]
MAAANSSDSSIPSTPPPLSSSKENVTPIGSKLAELNESRSELLGRIQGLKQDLQSWRSNLDTQVKVYHDELSELKKSLNTEVDQLRSEFQDLRTTLQQQQEDVTTSLRNLGLQDVSGEKKEAQDTEEPNVSTKVDEAKEEDDIACAIVCDAVTEIALSARCVLNIRLSGGAASYMIALYMYTSWFFELAMREESLVSFRR